MFVGNVSYLTLFPVPLPTGGWHSAACRTVHSMISIKAVSCLSVRAAQQKLLSFCSMPHLSTTEKKRTETYLPLLAMGHQAVSWSYTPSPSVALHHIPRGSPQGRLHAHGAEEMFTWTRSWWYYLIPLPFDRVQEDSKWKLLLYLTLQEKEDSGLDEVGVGALSASPFGGTFLLWFPLAEQSLKIWLIRWVSHKSST